LEQKFEIVLYFTALNN